MHNYISVFVFNPVASDLDYRCVITKKGCNVSLATSVAPSSGFKQILTLVPTDSSAVGLSHE